MDLLDQWAILVQQDLEDLRVRKAREDHLESLDLLVLQALLGSHQALIWQLYQR